MWQNIIAALIVAAALFFISRRAYRQFQRAIDPSQDASCSCSCYDCNNTCDSSKTIK